MSYLSNLTPEERSKINEKSRLTREAKRLAGESLIQDFEDENHWRNLASDLDIRLPSRYIPNSEVKHLKRVMKKLNINPKEYLEDCGCTTLKGLVSLNPTWPAWAEVSLMLEWYDEKYGDKNEKEEKK